MSPATSRGSIGLVAGLLLVAGIPATTASHEVPVVLDQYQIPEQGGYVAWEIQIDPADGSDHAELYLHLAEHARLQVESGAYAYLGIWMADLDRNTLAMAIAATIEMDGTDANVHTTWPRMADSSATLSSDWEGDAGGKLPVPEGHWLIVATWVTDGQLSAEATLGSGEKAGEPTTELLNKTGSEDVFQFSNGDFGGDVNVNLAADGEDTCSIPACGPFRNANVRIIENGSASVDVDNRLFGFFSAPGGIASQAGWTGPTGSGQGSTFYGFHGAAPGEYTFHVDENRDASADREPVAAFGADVELPFQEDQR